MGSQGPGGGRCLTSPSTTTGSTSSRVSKGKGAKSRPIADGFAPSDCRRVSGPHPAPSGTPTPIHGIRHLEERLERLAFPSEEVLRQDRAPLETYTTTSTEHGDIYRATDAYVAWLGTRVPGYGAERRCAGPPTRPTNQEDGGTPGGKSAWLNGRMKKAS